MERISLRRQAAAAGRCNVAVRRLNDGARMTAAVCPGCWNNPGRRRRLLEELAGMGVGVRYRDDRADGRYDRRALHAPGCPYA